MVVALDQQYNVGEKSTVILLYAYYIDRHAVTSKAETKNTIVLGTAQLCYVGSRVGWMSALLQAEGLTVKWRRLTESCPLG